MKQNIILSKRLPKELPLLERHSDEIDNCIYSNDSLKLRLKIFPDVVIEFTDFENYPHLPLHVCIKESNDLIKNNSHICPDSGEVFIDILTDTKSWSPVITIDAIVSIITSKIVAPWYIAMGKKFEPNLEMLPHYPNVEVTSNLCNINIVPNYFDPNIASPENIISKFSERLNLDIETLELLSLTRGPIFTNSKPLSELCVSNGDILFVTGKTTFKK